MTAMPAARVTDPFGHSSAMTGVLTGLAIGALVGVAIIATGGLGAIAIGAAIATTGAAGLAGQAIGQTIDGPVTGVLQNGSPNVRINRLAATMVMIGTGVCSQDSGLRKVASGSSTVKINGQLAARVSEVMDCSAVIRKGSPDVNIGGPTEQVLDIDPEVPAWLTTTMTVAAIGGTILATGGIAATYGAGAAIGSLVGGLGGGYLGGKGGEMAAAAMGYGATGQAIGGVLGGLAGGALGGAAGFRGGAALVPKTPPTQLASSVGVKPGTVKPGPLNAGPVEHPVYRIDGRPPATIFDEGFQPRGTSTDLKTYVDQNTPSGFVSTSKTPDIARNPDFAQPGKHFYEIDGSRIKGVDVNEAYPANPFAHEQEIAVISGIPRDAVISARPILPSGGLGNTIPNPNYGGGN